MTRRLPLPALAGAFAAVLTVALSAPAVAQSSMPPPPSMRDPAANPAPGPKKPAKPRSPKPAEADPAANPAARPDGKAAAKAAPPRGASESLPRRRIDPSDIADPYGGVGPREDRVAPTMTPSGRAGVGGRF